MALVAQPGMGKTTLLFQLLQRMRRTPARTVFLFQTCCNSSDLIRYLLQDLDICPAPDLASMHHQLNEVLLREARSGRQFVFVIDEAQNLSGSVLESIRLLSNFETSQGKLLQIILAGQPQLTSVLSHPEMQQLRQRISSLNWLEPFNTGDVAAYVRHRLQVAGHPDGSLFTKRALELIAKESGGIPRNINNLCFSALTEGFALGKHTIEREIVEEVVTDQQLSWLRAQNDTPQKQAGARQVITPPLALNSSSARPLWRYASIGAVVIFLVGLGLNAMPAFRVRQIVQSPLLTGQPSTRSQSASIRVSTATKQPVDATRVAAKRSAPPSFSKDRIVVVQTKQTLRQICLLYLGRCAPELIEELQALNPLLVDPNQLAVGQRLRLPVGKPRPRQALLEESSDEPTSGTKHE